MNKISIVIPLYNESGNIRPLYDKLLTTIKTHSFNYEIIFVDDGSTDNSIAILEILQKDNALVKVICLRKNFGKSTALNVGFQNVTGDIVATIDGDLQDDPATLPLLIDKISEGYDMVIGYRIKRADFFKSFFSKIFNFFTKLLTGTNLHDINCPVKVYKKEIVAKLVLYGELQRFIPVYVNFLGYKICEVRIPNYPRYYGKSKFGAERFLRAAFDLMTIIFFTKYTKRPIHLLGGIGVLTGGGGMAICFYLIFLHILYIFTLNPEYKMRDRPLLFFGFTLIILGVQFISLGLIAQMLIHLSAKNTSMNEEEDIIKKKF